MSTIQSIVTWAQNDIPDWQSDIVRRLLTQDKLTEQDEANILNMIKNLCGLLSEDVSPVYPQMLEKGDVSGAEPQPEHITLKAMNDLFNVNAIPDGSDLPFGHEGLSVIYGENGAGKSGYARVLKRACKARDTKERILPNVFEENKYEPAHAKFKVSINGGPNKEIVWKDGQDLQSELSNINVFDSKSAGIIVDGDNEVTYLPYGAHVFEDTVDLLRRLRKQLENERPHVKKLDVGNIQENTEAWKIIYNMTHATKVNSITGFAVWDDEKRKRLDMLKRTIAQAEYNNPQKQAKTIRNTKTRIIKLLEKIKIIDKSLSKQKEIQLKTAIEKSRETNRARTIAKQQSLADEPLQGAGDSVWQILYNAARDYSLQLAYPEGEFPETGDESRCVLCMQPLSDDGRKRLNRFNNFMEDTTSKEADKAAKTLNDLKKEINDIDIPSLESIKDTLEEIMEVDEGVKDKIKKYIPSMKKRSAEMIEMVVSVESNNTVSIMESSPEDDIVAIITDLESQAQEKEKSSNPELIKKQKKEKEELEAKKLFVDRKTAILSHLTKLKKVDKYNQCIDLLKTNSITRKGKSIVSGALTPALTEALSTELNKLKVTHLPLKLNPSGSDGETRHQLKLEGNVSKGKLKISEILSEGEQRVVALAGFLAELEISNHQAPIVFDDPVSSLDHRYREQIAERLVEESKTRQVLVFTHDISFLMALKTKSGDLEGTFHTQTIQRSVGSTGKSLDGLPWHAMTVKKRLGYLKNELSGLKKIYDLERDEYNKKAAQTYALLREVWESSIEEVLFNQTVFRHSEEVQTKRLKGVEVTNDDYKTIDLGMGKCSTWMFGHDKSKPLDINRPSPYELQDDIKFLEDFCGRIRSRLDKTRSQRDKQLQPKQPIIG